MRRGHVFDASCTAFWAVLFQACIAPALGQAALQAEAEPGTLHWALAVILGLVLIAGLIRSYRILKQTQHLTVVRHAPEGMRIVECGNCRTPQYVSAHGRIFICCGCHCANRIPLEVGRTEELIVPEGPLKKFEFKKGGENYWQEPIVSWQGPNIWRIYLFSTSQSLEMTQSPLFNARKKWQEAEAKVASKKMAHTLRRQRSQKPPKELPDREHWEALMMSSWQNLIDAPASVKADPQCVEIAVERTWKALQYAADELRDDPIFVRPIVEKSWWALECVGENARRDEEVAIAALKQSSWAFECLPDELRGDLLVLKAAVRSDGTALRYASQELRTNRGLVEEAVRRNGGDALQYASEELRNEPAFVMKALEAPKGSSTALAFSAKLAADRPFADTSVVLAALKQNGESLQFAPEKFRDSRKVVDVAVKQNPKALRFASEDLREDEELVKEVAQIDGSVLQFAAESLCANWRVANKAVAQTWEALPFEQVDGGLSRELLLGSVKQDWRAIEELLQKNPDLPQDFLVEAAALNPEIVRAEELRGNWEVAFTALSLNGLMLQYLLDDLRADPELASVAIRQNPDAMDEVHPCLRKEKDLLVIQKEGLVRRARAELRRMKAEAAAQVAIEAMQEDGESEEDPEFVQDEEAEVEPAPPAPPAPPAHVEATQEEVEPDEGKEAAQEAESDESEDEEEEEVSQEELEDGADLALTPSRPQRVLEEDVDKVAPSVIGKVDVESASNDGGLPQCVVCLDETGNMVLLPCAHGGVCEDCVTRIVQNRAFGGAHCPHCRSGISTIVKLQEVEGELAKGVELRIPMARPAQVWLKRSFSSTTPASSSSVAPSAVSAGCDKISHQADSIAEVGRVELSKASDIVFRGTMEEDLQGGARHAPTVSRLWSNVPVHVRESFKAPARLEDSPKPSAPLLVDSVISGVKQLVARSGLGPSHWSSDVGRPYYGGRIQLAPYKKGQTAAFNYPSILVPREVAHRFPLDMYVDPVFQTSDAAQRIRMRGFTLFPRLQNKTTLLLIFSGQPLSGLWTGLQRWLDAVGSDFKALPNTQVFKLHCEEGWFNRRTHQLTKFQLRRQVDESEIWSTFVYRGANMLCTFTTKICPWSYCSMLLGTSDGMLLGSRQMTPQRFSRAWLKGWRMRSETLPERCGIAALQDHPS
eukprot:symbB.v1.2.026820.t2/scaffold2709.1/size72633/3